MGVAGALAGIPNGTMLLLDGQSGTIVLDPNRDELEEAKVQVSRRHKLELQLEAVVGEPAVTPSGRAIVLMGNVDLPEEIEAASRHGAEGVGLLRTEFLLTGRAGLPTEDEQTDYFRRVARAFPRTDGRDPVVRSGRGQVPRGLQGTGRGQSIPGLALHPGLPRRAGGVSPPDPGGAARRGRPRHPAHAAAGDHGAGGAGVARDRGGGGARR